jgi:phosphate transport system substrate-binding protein
MVPSDPVQSFLEEFIMRRSASLCWSVIGVVLLLVIPITGWAQLTYEGSSSIGDALFPALAKAFTAKTGIQFGTINPTNSVQGFTAVRDGKSSLGGLSRLLTQEELKSGLANQVIGYDALVVYVHPGSPIENLTLDQIKKIFSGQITSWKDVGGQDSPILTLVKKGGEEGGVVGQFRELVMGGDALATPAASFPSHKENVEFVASNPTAITFASLAGDLKVGKMISVEGIHPSPTAVSKGDYPLARPFLLIYKENPPNPDVAKFMEFVFAREGQAIVKEFVVPVMAFDEPGK